MKVDWHFNQNTENSHFVFKIHKLKYVVESPEILFRMLSSIRIEREKCVKAQNVLKTLAKKCIFPQISEGSTCMHLHHLELNSVGQCHLKDVETFPADPKTTWCEDSIALIQLTCKVIIFNSEKMDSPSMIIGHLHSLVTYKPLLDKKFTKTKPTNCYMYISGTSFGSSSLILC